MSLRNMIANLSAIQKLWILHAVLSFVEGKEQTVKQLKLDIFLKNSVRKNSDETWSETADEPLPSYRLEETQKPYAVFFSTSIIEKIVIWCSQRSRGWVPAILHRLCLLEDSTSAVLNC
jgi:hypothetical protein